MRALRACAAGDGGFTARDRASSLAWAAALLLAVAPAQAKIRADWSRVAAVPPGTKTIVRLYKDEAPAGHRKVRGQFSSATSDAVTLIVAGGRSRTFQKVAVRGVLVPRPWKKRMPGWVALAASGTATTAWNAWLHKHDRLTPQWWLFFYAVATLPITLGVFHGSRNGAVYNLPVEHR